MRYIRKLLKIICKPHLHIEEQFLHQNNHQHSSWMGYRSHNLSMCEYFPTTWRLTQREGLCTSYMSQKTGVNITQKMLKWFQQLQTLSTHKNIRNIFILWLIYIYIYLMTGSKEEVEEWINYQLETEDRKRQKRISGLKEGKERWKIKRWYSFFIFLPHCILFPSGFCARTVLWSNLTWSTILQTVNHQKSCLSIILSSYVPFTVTTDPVIHYWFQNSFTRNQCSRASTDVNLKAFNHPPLFFF